MLAVSGLLLGLAYEPIKSAIRGFLNTCGDLGLPPIAFASLQVAAVLILVPVLLSTIFHLGNNGLVLTLRSMLAFWLRGLKMGVICLIPLAPCILVLKALHHWAGEGGIGRGVAMARLAVVAAVFLLAPIWALAVARRLSHTALGRRYWAELVEPERPLPESSAEPGRRPN